MSNEPQIGTIFSARYEILSVLGAGGIGVVYKARDLELDDLVAIKTLRGETFSSDPTLLEGFKQEIRLARQVTHANVLRTYDLGESNGLKFFSMELVEGITLKELIETAEIVPTTVGLPEHERAVRGAGERDGATGSQEVLATMMLEKSREKEAGDAEKQGRTGERVHGDRWVTICGISHHAGSKSHPKQSCRTNYKNRDGQSGLAALVSHAFSRGGV